MRQLGLEDILVYFVWNQIYLQFNLRDVKLKVWLYSLLLLLHFKPLHFCLLLDKCFTYISFLMYRITCQQRNVANTNIFGRRILCERLRIRFIYHINIFGNSEIFNVMCIFNIILLTTVPK